MYIMASVCLLRWNYLCFILFAEVVVASWSPKYVWPLGDTSVYREVMEGQDGHLPVSNQCFVFSEGYPGLPYRALTLTGQDNSYVDFYLNGREEFTDLAISLYIYPSGEPDGTIFNYMCETGNIIKLAVLQGMLFVSFWDEFGVSVGATAVSDLLVANTWSHLLVSREFDTGRIKVFHNGDVVDNIDDDFPNKIRLPNKGSIRLGSSQKEKSDGRFQVNLETQVIDGQEKQCVTDYVAPREIDIAPKQCDVIDLSCLSSGLNWNWVLRKHQWTGSNRDTAHFHLIGRDHVPVQNGNTILGNIVTSNKMVCSRLCLRVDGCKAFSSAHQSHNTTRCVLYSDAVVASQFEVGAVFFSLT